MRLLKYFFCLKVNGLQFLLKPNSQQWENIQIFTHFTVLMKHGIHTKTLVVRIKIKTRTIITEKMCI